MTKEEALSLGVAPENIREFQRLYGRDVTKAATRAKEAPDPTRAAIVAMLPMIRRPENLAGILREVNRVYYVERRYLKPEEATK